MGLMIYNDPSVQADSVCGFDFLSSLSMWNRDTDLGVFITVVGQCIDYKIYEFYFWL